MAITPEQLITISGFADHRFSNTFSRFSRIVTGNQNVILPFDNYVFDVTIGDSSTSVNITSGIVCKDDIMIQITDATTELDFTDPSNYVGSSTTMAPPPSHPTNYLVLLKYSYQRTLPAPSAVFVVCKSREEFLNNRDKYIYLASARVALDGGSYKITNIYYTDTDELNGDAIIERPVYRYTPPVVYGGLIS